MIKKWHVKLSFKWFDFWMGFFVDLPAKTVYICLLPMLPVKIYFTEHVRCPECSHAMQKMAYDTGDGWGLSWECPDCYCDDAPEIEWPFGTDMVSVRDLRRLGYEIV